MPNPIKYSTGSETLALKKGNFWIGTGDVGKGPTSSTGYYNGITPPSGGYTIYLNKESGGPSIYTASNDAQLISLTNSIAGQSYTTVNECLVYFAGQTDKICVNRDYEGIVTNGLIFNLDAGFTPSYPKNNTTWYDISNTNSGTLTNGPTFSSNDGGSISFDGANDYVIVYGDINTTLGGLTSITVQSWIKPPTSPGQYCGYVSRQTYAYDDYKGFSIRQSSNINTLIEWFGFGSNNNKAYATVTPNTWNLITGTWNGSNMRVYVNGSQADSITPIVNDINASGQYLNLGKLSYGNFFQSGNIASVQIYNRVLTASEISQNYNAQKGRFGL